MSRSTRRWVAATTGTCVALGLAGWSALAQQAGKSKFGDENRWREMATLIEQGQLNLRAAAELAEKHTKGTALEVRCDIVPIASESQRDQDRNRAGTPPDRGQPGGQFDQPLGKTAYEQPSGMRLVYDVSCFAKDQLETVRVDAMTKKVIEGQQRP